QVQQIDFAELVQNELGSLDAREPNQSSKVQLSCRGQGSRAFVLGNASMLSRMIRNALENAIQHARDKILIEIWMEEGHLHCRIGDDGHGFSPEALRGFGIRSHEKRDLAAFKSGLSAGLGSAIMKSICEIHGGIFSFGNLVLPNGELGGAQVSFRFKILSADGGEH
ncbi:MAG: ATP-binding protein, partial [Bdellovibrionales bacterium]|nr:ATP-binding protein [Bdellovibrionales bacterium]